MKIRDRLVRKQWKFTALIAATMILWAAIIWAVWITSPNNPPDWMFNVLGGLLAPIAFGVIGLKYLIRCPRCKGNLGGKFSSLGARQFLWFKPVQNCPYCGVSLDQAAP